MSNALPDLSSKVVSTDTGRMEPIWASYFRKLQKDVASALATLTGNDDEVAVIYATKDQSLSLPTFIDVPEDKDYVFAAVGLAGSITSVVTECTSGTCALTVLIGSTELGGDSNAVSTTRVTQEHSVDNALASGDDITIRISSNSDCEGLSVTLNGSRTLA